MLYFPCIHLSLSKSNIISIRGTKNVGLEKEKKIRSGLHFLSFTQAHFLVYSSVSEGIDNSENIQNSSSGVFWKSVLRSSNKHLCSSSVMSFGLVSVLQCCSSSLSFLCFKTLCPSTTSFFMGQLCPSFDDPLVQPSTGFHSAHIT